MFISKIALPRRTFLRGVGVSLALPLLDAMVPALTPLVATAASPAPRLGFFYAANGITMEHWTPVGEGSSFELSPILTTLASLKDQMVVVSRCANGEADSRGLTSGPHTRAHCAFITGARAKRAEGSDIACGTSLDQVAAKTLGKDTPLSSLELAIEPNYIVGNCDNGYSCTYQNTFVWRTPTQPVPMENNPRVVFERMFGDGGSAAARVAQMQTDRSILDIVTKNMAHLRQSLGPRDRGILGDYLDAVRDVETRIQTAEGHAATSPVSDRPSGIPEDEGEQYTLMFDMQFLAYQADITRVVTMQVSREQSQRTYPQAGVPNGHHEISHHGHLPERMVLNSKINSYHLSQMGRLAEKMRNTPDGDGTLLDHAMLWYGGGMGDGNLHSPHDLAIVIVGGGCGQLKTGRHVVAKYDTPVMNLGLSVLDKVGVHVDSVGDSTGHLVDF